MTRQTQHPRSPQRWSVPSTWLPGPLAYLLACLHRDSAFCFNEFHSCHSCPPLHTLLFSQELPSRTAELEAQAAFIVKRY